MNTRRMTGRIIAVLVMTMALALVAVPAWAGPVIGPHVVVVGTKGQVDLIGKSQPDAAAAIASVAPDPTFGTMTLTGRGLKFGPFKVYAGQIGYVDRATVLNSALAASADMTITPAYKLQPTVWSTTGAWVHSAAKKFDIKPSNAYFKVYKGKLLLVPSVNSFTVDQSKTRLLVVKALLARAKVASNAAMVVGVATKASVKPKVTTASLSKVKTIVVVLSKRTVTLYTGGKVTVWYRCAIGQPAHPTPTGLWYVYKKVKGPSWTNPGSAWASNMPSYIPPGPSNPLGLAAMYLKNVATNVDMGIRIHGTKNIGSIGTAASHGCIRLANYNVVKLYAMVPVGTKVYIVR